MRHYITNVMSTDNETNIITKDAIIELFNKNVKGVMRLNKIDNTFKYCWIT